MQTPVYLQIVYWLSTPALAALVILFLYRKLYKDFPVFFSYAVVACLDDIARFIALRLSFRIYNNTYWITELLNTVLALAAINELFLRRLFPKFHRVGFYRYLFSITAVIVVVLAALTALNAISVSVLINFLRFTDFTRVATLCFFIALMLFMGRSWSRYEFGLTAGFVIDAAAFLATFALGLKRHLHGVVALLPVVAFDLASLIWLVYFLRAEEVTPVKSASPELVETAKKWEKMLKDSLAGKKTR